MLSLVALASLSAASLASAQTAPRVGPFNSNDTTLLTDMRIIARHWGQISPYQDQYDGLFGVADHGLPDGCAVEQVHLMQRHAQRFATSFYDDGVNDESFAGKLANFTAANPAANFTGPLAFLNRWRYTLAEGYLTNLGAATEFSAGAMFWNRYGRLLFNATAGQTAYNASFPNGTARARPVLRTTSQSRMWNSQINWALGFFGPSFQETPDPTLNNWTAPFDVVVIAEGGSENNTLAAYDSCKNEWASPVLDMGDIDLETYIPVYLAKATKRLSGYVPAGFTLTANDTYAFQSLCAYENAHMGESEFCDLFTAEEWSGFELTLDAEYYYDYAWGNPTGRAQGIGYVQELLARLKGEYITVSESSVNSTLDNNEKTFPLGREFYADFTHDDIIISILTAMSMDYFKEAPDFKTYPPKPDRRFILSQLTPSGARLVTEVIGCTSPTPLPVGAKSTIYRREANGYDAATATNKFVRMRLNNAILPIGSIRGGKCAGRTDAMCPLDKFLESQANSTALANYQYACFGNWNVTDVTSGKDYDGTIFPAMA